MRDTSVVVTRGSYHRRVIFEWDAQKAADNLRKHGLSFPEAVLAFRDPLSRTIADPDHSDNEERWILLGETPFGRLVVVVHTG